MGLLLKVLAYFAKTSIFRFLAGVGITVFLGTFLVMLLAKLIMCHRY